MLTKFKSHHIRKIIWGLIFVIIPAFILWGSIYYFSARRKNIVGTIENHPILAQDFYRYIKLAQLHYLFLSKDGYPRDLSREQLEAQAWQLYLLLWKVNKDKIIVSDQEVVEAIKNFFSLGKKFDKDLYFRILKRYRVEPRVFEEFIRKKLKINKLFDKYIKIEVKDEEILDLYKKLNEKAKIGYIFIPYTKFEKDLEITEGELKSFYEENKGLFKEEPKVKFKYIFISKENYLNIKEDLHKEIKKVDNVETLSKALNLAYKETGYLSIDSPIEGIGWEPNIIKTAFSISKGRLSEVLETNNGFIVFEKIDEKEAGISPFESIKDKIKEKVKKEKVKALAESFVSKLLNEIKTKNIKTLETVAKIYKLEYKETDYFKYFDYIEGVGLSKELSETIFERRTQGEIVLTPFLLSKGAYLIQIEDFIPIDKKKFEQERDEYRKRIYNQKLFAEQIRFISQLQKELNLKIYTNPPR